MPRKRKWVEPVGTYIEIEFPPHQPHYSERVKRMIELTPGFYLVGEDACVKTVNRIKGKGEAREIVTEPVRFRTINAAKDAAALCSDNCNVLLVRQDCEWPC